MADLAVLVEPVGSVVVGTPVTVVSWVPDIGEPTTARIRLRDGRELDAPSRAVGVRDVDVKTSPGVFVVRARWQDDPSDVVTSSTIRIVEDLGGRYVLGPPVTSTVCGGFAWRSVELADATGDGRPEVVAVLETDTCEVGWTSDTLEIYRAADLAPLGTFEAPVYPLVGPVASGVVRWSPGRVEVSVAREGCPDVTGTCMERADDVWTWDGAAYLRISSSVTPLTATLHGRSYAVRSISPDVAVELDGVSRPVPPSAVQFAVDTLGTDLDGLPSRHAHVERVRPADGERRAADGG